LSRRWRLAGYSQRGILLDLSSSSAPLKDSLLLALRSNIAKIYSLIHFDFASTLILQANYLTMKLSIALLATAISGTTSFVVQPTSTTISSTSLNAEEKEKFAAVAAEIRGPTKKNDVLEFGWDGTTALGGAVDDSKPARFLDDIRASGETQSEACDLFNANLGKL